MQNTAIVIAKQSGMKTDLCETASGHRAVFCKLRKIFRLIRNYGSMAFNLINRIRIESRNQEERNPVTELDGCTEHKDNRFGTVFSDILVDRIRMLERTCQTVEISVVNYRTELFVEIDVRADFRNFLIGALAEPSIPQYAWNFSGVVRLFTWRIVSLMWHAPPAMRGMFM